MQTVALGVNSNVHGSAVLGGLLIGVLPRIVAARGKLLPRGIREFERLAVSTDESVGNRVEGQITSESHGSDDIGARHKGVGGRVRVITAGEVAVVRRDNYKELELFTEQFMGKRINVLEFFSPFLTS